MNAVLNHLWQSTALALLAAVVAFWFRPNRAHVRYLVWLAASSKFLLPFSLLIEAGSRLRPPSPYLAPAILATAESLGEPFARTTGVVVPLAARSPRSIAPFLLGLWMCGLVGVVAVWSRRWLRAIKTVRSAEPFESEALTAVKTRLGISVPVRLVASDTNLEPGVFGLFRPVVIIPTGLRDKLAAGQLESVIAHELCHIRRLDNLAALIHMLIEGLFWFYPLVW